MRLTAEEIQEKVRNGEYNFQKKSSSNSNSKKRLSAEEIQRQVKERTFVGLDYDYMDEKKRQILSHVPKNSNSSTSQNNKTKAAAQLIKNQDSKSYNDMSYEEKKEYLDDQKNSARKAVFSGLGNYIKTAFLAGISDDKKGSVQEALDDFNSAKSTYEESKENLEYLNENKWNETQKENSNTLSNDTELTELVKNAYEAKMRYTSAQEGLNAQPSYSNVNSAASGIPSLASYVNVSDTTSDYENAIKAITSKGYSTEEAESLIDTYSRQVNAEAQSQRTEKTEKFANEHPVLASGAYIASNVGQLAGTKEVIQNGLSNLITGDYKPLDTNTYGFAATNFRDTVSETVSGNIKEGVTEKTDSQTAANAAEFLYQTGLSIGDFVSLAGLGQPASLAVMGTSAAMSTAKDATDRGVSADKAMLNAIAAGTAEIVFEKLSLDNLNALKATGRKGVKNTVTDILKQTFTEGSEETFTDIANALTDQIINGDDSALQQQYQEFLDSGMSEQEAKKQVAVEFGKQLGESFLGGAISGGVMGAGGVAYRNIATQSNYRNVGNELKNSGNAQTEINKGLAFGNESRAHQAAAALQNSLEQDISYDNDMKPIDYSSLSSRKLGKLQYYNTQEGSKTAFAEAVKDENNSAELNRIFTKITDGKSISRSEARTISESRAAVQALNTEFATEYTADTVSRQDLNELSRYYDNDARYNAGYGISRLNTYGAQRTAREVTLPDGSSDYISGENGVNKVENGKVYLNTANGSVVEAGQLDFADNDTRLLYEGASVYDTNEAKSYVKGYTDNGYNGTVADYSSGFGTVYTAQKQGKSLDEAYQLAVQNGSHITPIQAELAYNAARNSSIIANRKADFNAVINAQKKPGATVISENVSKEQQAEIHVLGEYAKSIGREIVVVDDTEELGYRKANGFYKNGKIVLALNADGGMLSAYFGHELFHDLKVNSKEQAQKLEDFVIDYLKNKADYDYNARVDELIELNKFRGTREQQEAQANEEIAANACFTVFSEQKNFERLVQQDKPLAQKVRDFFAEFIEKIKNALDSIYDRNAEYRALQNEEKAQEKILAMFDACLKASDMSVSDSNENVKFSLKETFDSNYDFDANIKKVADMSPVADLSGNEFAKGNVNLITQVTEYFKSIGNKVNSKYGTVTLNRTGVKSSVSHGIGRNKAIAFKAVPDVIKNGEIIDYQQNYKKRGYDSAVFAAPITINNQPYFVAAVVRVEADNNSYYLHELAITKKEDATPFKTGTDQVGTPSGETSSIYSLLNKLQNVNKNRSLATTPSGDNSFSQTSKTLSGTTSIDTVPQNDTVVNSSNMQDEPKFSLKTDSDGNELSEQQQEYFKDSKVRDNNGSLLVLYHQTGADFTVFNTDNQKAGKYDSEMPTGIFLKSTENDIGLSGKKQMKVYADLKNPIIFNNRSEAKHYFERNISEYKKAQDKISDIDKEYQKKYDEEDIRDDVIYKQLFQNFKEKKITSKEFKDGIENTQTKRILNEWTNASDNARLEAKLLIDEYFADSDYDGMIVIHDTGSFGRSVSSYIAFHSNQIKNVDNKNPTADDDIRFSLKENSDYSYDTLVSKPDMPVTVINDKKDYTPGKSTRENVIDEAQKSALSVGRKDKSSNVFVYVNDTGTEVMLSKRGLRHSLDRRLSIIAPVTENIGPIIKNSIRINELSPELDTIEKSYVLIGIAKNQNNEPYVVSFVVNRASNEVTSVDVLYAVNTKTEPAGSLSPELSSQSDVSLTGSNISISDLLDYVNRYYPDILPEDVLRHYGYSARPDGAIGESALYSLKEQPIDYNAVLRDNEELSEMNEDLQRMLELTSSQNEKLKNEFKITGRHNLSNSAVDRVATQLRKQYASTYDKTSLVSNVSALYDYIANAGTDIDSGYIWTAAHNIAMNIVDNTQQKDTAVYDEYKNLRERIRNTAIRVPETVRDNFTDYEQFRKSNFGRLRLSNNSGVELDSFYNELSAEYPEFFDVDVPEEQQLESLANFFASTAPVYYNASENAADSMGLNMQQYANLVAGDILEKYFDVPEVKTVAEKHKKEMDSLKLHYRNQISELRQSYKERYDERLEEVKKENRQRVNRLRQDKADALAKQKAHFEDVSKRGRERRSKSKLRASIRKSLNKIAAIGANPDKKKHIPNAIIDSVKAFADAVALDDTKQDQKIRDRLNQFRNGFESIKRTDTQYAVISELYNDFISNQIVELQNMVGDKTIKQLSVSELEEIDKLLKMTAQSINNINRLFLKDRNATIEQYADNIASELEPFRKGKIRNAPLNSLAFNSLKPEYFFQYIGSDTLLDLYHNLRKGEDTWAVDVSQAREYALEIRKKYGWQKWDTKTKQKFNTTYGEIELTLQERLGIYANSLGEHTKNHLLGGGFKYQQSKATGIGKLKKQTNDNSSHRLSEEDVSNIVASLSNEQTAYVRDMINYLSTVMGEKGNEISRQLYDIELFKEKMYYPAKVDRESTHQSTKEVRAEKQIKNAGFTNAAIVNAKQPLILMDFDDVWASHVDEMSKYHAFVLPLENLDRVYNLYEVGSDYNYTSVKEVIKNAYGRKALSYIDDLIRDINGGVVQEAGTDILSSLTSKFKKNAVFASASVTIQQPSAIARALSEIDIKYLTKTTGSGFSRKAYEEMKKYAPVAIIKEMGYFDTNMAQSTIDYLNKNDYKGLKEKAKAFVIDGSYRDDAMSFFASKADEITWTHIWNAVKAETRAKNPELSENSEQLLSKSGERFTDVIAKTQVYDSVFSRSGLMRSRDNAVKNAMAFMAEPTTSLNMLTNAVTQAKRGTISKSKAGRVFASLISASMLNSILQSIVTAARADDDEKDWKEVYLSQLLPNFIDNLNPVNQIAFLKDIYNIFQGYDVTRADMNLFSDLYNAIQRLDSDKVTISDKVTGLAGAISAFFGFPLKNINRDVKAAYNVAKDFFDDKVFSSESALDLFKEEMNSYLGFELFNSKYEKAVKSIENGNMTDYEQYADELYAGNEAYDLLYEILKQYGYNSSQYKKEMDRCVEIKKENGASNPNPDTAMKNRAIKEYAQLKENGTYTEAEAARQRCIQLYGDATKVKEALDKLND